MSLMTGGDNSDSPNEQSTKYSKYQVFQVPSRDEVYRRAVGRCPTTIVKLSGVAFRLETDASQEGLGAVGPASDGRENVLLMTDIFTKFTHAVPTRD